MSFLQENNTQNLAARITNYGRKKIAQGNFNIEYFQIGDSEFDYGFSMFDGEINRAQKILMPLDKDSQVKYPYKVSPSSVTGTTYGIPILSADPITTIRNNMGAAGFVSEYCESTSCSGSTIVCGIYATVLISALSGTTIIYVPDTSIFNNVDFITVYLDTLGPNDTILNNYTSFVYKIIEVHTGYIIVDRVTPYLEDFLPKNITIIPNYCYPNPIYPEDQQDSWILDTIWSQNPAGLDSNTSLDDEKLSGYTSNVFVSTKEFFGYNTSSGQTYNTGTTITNSFGDITIVLPEEQHSLSVIHYSKAGDILTDPELTFKYEDYIAHSTTDDIEYFEIYIPFIFYERNSGSTVGARFFMDSTDYYINSLAIDTKVNQIKYRCLLDEQDNRVGKIFVNHKVIIFDDQEIVAALEPQSQRRYTLPIPRIALVPIDSKCSIDGDPLNPMLSGTPEQTVFMSYLLEYTGDTALNGLHCNHYLKIIGGTIDGDVSIKFGDEDFKFMGNAFEHIPTSYIANKFSILVQKVPSGTQPDPMGWKVIDFTDQIPNHIVGDMIDPINLRGARFIVTFAEYDDASIYVLPDPDLATTQEFGDEQPFPGSIKLVRATDVEVMRYLINLPSGYFETTQNPSYVIGKNKRITEAALLDGNKNVLVMAKASSPIKRIGTQVLSVKIDI